jgi:hypothetical protein
MNFYLKFFFPGLLFALAAGEQQSLARVPYKKIDILTKVEKWPKKLTQKGNI